MFSKSALTFAILSALSFSAEARIRWLERDGKAVFLHPRRFGQEHPAVIDKIGSACEGQVCGVLSGQAITPLLAAQGECTQQDMADQIIDASRQFDSATQANMIALAIEYRQAEKNTPPDFTTNPPTNRNSVFCQKAPKNPELNGLVQAQDPANNPNVFFDPATSKSVQKGSQANTSPFDKSGSPNPVSSSVSAAPSAATSNVNVAVSSSASPCVTAVTVTVTAGNNLAISTSTSAPPAASSAAGGSGNIGNFGSCSVPQIQFGVGFDNRKETSFEPVDQKSYNHGSADNIDIITKFMCDTLTNKCGADQTAKSTCAQAITAADGATKGTGAQADAFNAVFNIKTNFAAVTEIDNQGRVVPGTGSGAGASGAPSSVPASTGSTGVPAASGTASGIGNFGSCSVPQIEFGAGFDNRKETSFQPVDKTSYNHGSADNIDIITKFMCDTLTNSCKADQTAKDTCAKAITAADGATKGTGAQADAFNAVFAIKTDFAAVTEIDDQGNVVSGTGSSSNNNVASPGSGTPANTGSATTPAASGSSGGIGNFGSCSVPQIEFGVGFDNRKETSFEPVDKASYNHGSADNIDIITKFMCDTLTNSCKADQTAKDTCAKAITAADGATKGTGAQADAFNAVFNIKTNFAAVTEIDNQGRVVSGTGNSGSGQSSSVVDVPASSSVKAAPSSTSASQPASTGTSNANGANLQKFTGKLGGATAPPVTDLGNGQFQVEGNASFKNLQNALTRSCDVQHNQCANAANASGNKGALTVEACGQQQTQCDSSSSA